jgi:hypothetical protein
MKNSSVLTVAFLCLVVALSSTISHFIRGVHAQNTSAAKAGPKVPFDVSTARLERNRRIASS